VRTHVNRPEIVVNVESLTNVQLGKVERSNDAEGDIIVNGLNGCVTVADRDLVFGWKFYN